MTDLVCWNCGQSLDDIPLPISRQADCQRCYHELHCCRMCRHYDPSISTGQCAEDRADPPVIKENANFCEWFEPRSGAFTSGRSEKHAAAQAKLNALFGADDPPPDSPTGPDTSKDEEDKSAAARAKLEALFSTKPVSKKRDDDAT